MRKAFVSIVCILVMVGSCTKKASPTAEAKIDASMVFANNCARCHGQDGATGRAPNLKKLDVSKADISMTITKGQGHMPAFEDKLTEKEIAAVTAYVFALRN